jgi:hypothetical protein
MSDDAIQLKRETITGFVDRGDNFRIGEGNTYRAERWVSDYFDLREREASTEAGPAVHSVPPGDDADTITLKKETSPGFVDRGNNFQVRTDGNAPFTASRWVSGYFNVRSASE